jgi:hypothetical protein
VLASRSRKKHEQAASLNRDLGTLWLCWWAYETGKFFELVLRLGWSLRWLWLWLWLCDCLCLTVAGTRCEWCLGSSKCKV